LFNSKLKFWNNLPGNQCETSYNPCVLQDGSSVCLNTGFCTVNLACFPYYQCSCSYGYYGTNCQYATTTTTTSSTTTIYSDCFDQDSDKCTYYAQNQLCSNFFLLNNVPIPKYCPKSCKICSSTIGCFDSQSSCVVWKIFNLCDRLSGISPHPCRKSCNLCT